MSEQMISPETQTEEAITVEVQPVHIPEEHRENICPMDDNVSRKLAVITPKLLTTITVGDL
jgi:hypothetical protein